MLICFVRGRIFGVFASLRASELSSKTVQRIVGIDTIFAGCKFVFEFLNKVHHWNGFLERSAQTDVLASHGG